ncbi:hypothetical protein GmHk_01G000605 [Glycine max]|nr:hypothetical protein GmHk_01G000605 [Glycine max]
MGIQEIQNTRDLAEPIEEIYMPSKSSLNCYSHDHSLLLEGCFEMGRPIAEVHSETLLHNLEPRP